MKLYVWVYNFSQYWCVNKSLKLARKYMKKTYNESSGHNYFDDPPYIIMDAPFAVSVLDPYRTTIYKNGKKLINVIDNCNNKNDFNNILGD